MPNNVFITYNSMPEVYQCYQTDRYVRIFFARFIGITNQMYESRFNGIESRYGNSRDAIRTNPSDSNVVAADDFPSLCCTN